MSDYERFAATHGMAELPVVVTTIGLGGGRRQRVVTGKPAAKLSNLEKLMVERHHEFNLPRRIVKKEKVDGVVRVSVKHFMARPLRPIPMAVV